MSSQGCSQPAASDEATPATILVIDDEPCLHTSLRRILSRRGHRVDSAGTAQEGLSKLAADDYHLVVSDVVMPQMDGLELLEHLAQSRRHVPVLVITGYPTPGMALRALRLGAVDYIAKPFTLREFLGPVNRVLWRARAAAKAGYSGGRQSSAGMARGGEATRPPVVDLRPGDRFQLGRHSWAVYRPDRTMEIGIHTSILSAVSDVVSIEVPAAGHLIQQGVTRFKLDTAIGEEHSVRTPLSGQVVETNARALERPQSLAGDTWIARIMPTSLDAELVHLDLLSRG